ncbi:MAG: tetratricopeptide repeat protein [Alphaproteobacteria bacterium]|nr:tetratricopeptide repeat protein [Alphaproteobacteria bacterium]
MSNTLQQAVAAHQANNLVEAEKLYRSVLNTAPEHADALALLGLVRGTHGDHAEAVGLVEKAIALDPKSALFRLHLGNILMNAKKMPEAVAAFKEAILRQPNLAQAHYNLGNALRAADDWTGTIAAYRAAVKHNPAYAEAHNNLALAYVHEKRMNEAMEHAKKSVAIAPDYGEGWCTLSNVAESTKDYPLALAAAERTLQLMPDSHYGWFGYGVALNRLDRNEEAVAAYKRALEIKPERADIWDNLGQTYQSLNWLDEAEATFRKTVEVAGQAIAGEDTREVAEEEYGNRHWHLALMELLRGKYKPGFARYRSRFREVGGLQRPKFSRPVWKGESLSGKTILVCDEQGFGDTLMFCRYLPLMKEQGARIIFSVHPALEPLFKGWPGADELIVHGSGVSNYDYYASVFDLPHRFGTVLETIPAQTPYLPLLPSDDATRLADAGKPRVGVVWGGNPLHTNDARRSVPLEIFSGLFQEAGVQFYSLNRDRKPGDEAMLAQHPVIDLVPKLNNFADAARIVGQLDLIITCDTATAHLAGGMGKQTWVLLPFAPDWRWLTGRNDNPWYPTLRLFRQERIGDWQGVMAKVLKALAEYVCGRPNL